MGSLALSLVAFILPFGIAAVVMGHMSRSQIRNSQGRERGMGVAFTALIFSYLQFVVVMIIFLALIPVWNEMTRALNSRPYLRAALLQRIENGDPYHPSKAALEQSNKDLMDALHLIRARENSYHARADSYVCSLSQLTADDQELKMHVDHAYGRIRLFCRYTPPDSNPHGYVVTAFHNGISDSRIYCLDQTEVIRAYANDRVGDVRGHTFMLEPCPEDGEPVE